MFYNNNINKSQGQTLKVSGVDLRGEVFSHGQLYIYKWDSHEMVHQKIK